MTQPFPNTPYLSGNYAPILMESDAHDLVIEGEMPRDLHGVFYRNGPNPQYPPLGKNHHWFAGDGMIHALRIEDGRVSYRNRWVHTERFKLEREAGRRLFAATLGGPNADDAPADANTALANTNIVWHGEKLLALVESHPPTELDPDSLDTIGPWTFNDDYAGPFTAHPKLDPETKEMFFFGYMAKGPATPDIAFGIVDGQGNLKRQDYITAPYASMVHDFIATDKDLIFPIFPATVDVERIMNGGPMIAWDPDQGTHIGVLGQNDDTDTLRWFQGEACYVYHPMNAYRDGSKIIADVMKYNRVPLFPNADGSRSPEGEGLSNSSLVRWTFDLDANTDSYSEDVLDDQGGEFPRFDERFAGRSYRHGFYAVPNKDEEFDRLVHLDLKTGTRRVYNPGDGSAFGEPLFIPRSASADEGDGYLIALAYRPQTNTSDLLVFDASDISAGPVATAKLPVRIPHGFHGNWRQL